MDSASRLDIPDLSCVGQFCQRKLSFCRCVEFSYIRAIGRLDDFAGGVEKAIKSGVQKSCCLLGWRFLAFHQITQLVLCARIQEIDCVILDRGVNSRLVYERIAAIRERGVAQFVDFVHRRKLGPKCLLQVSLSVGGDSALCQIKPECSQRCNDHHDRGEQSGAKARDPFVSRCTRGAHGKSTCSVCPSFNSTGFWRVVLLSIHAFSV